MMALATSPRTLTVPAPVTLSHRATAVRQAKPAPRRSGFWTTLLRALSASAA